MNEKKEKEIIIVGCGIFGITSCLELNSRKYKVTIIDEIQNSEPDPFASSEDISKIVRADYGDRIYF